MIPEELFHEPTAAPESPFANAPDIDVLRRNYREFDNATKESRELSLRDSEYYHGFKQLSAVIRTELAKRRQPPAYFNKIRPAIQGVLGLLDSNQTDPQAIGRNDADEEAAQVVTQLLRYFEDHSDFQDVKREASHDYLVYGTLAAITEVDEHGDARTSHIPWREFFYDPHSLRHDFQDAKYLGQAKWVEASTAERMFPEAAARIGSLRTSNFGGEGLECQPELKSMWLDANRSRVRLVDLYYRDDKSGVWHQAIYCHAGLLHFARSPYQDDEGLSACPITAVSFEVDDEGQRYGMVRDMVPLQDIINNNWSKQTHILNSAQVEATDANANPTDRETARQEAARPDGVMPAGWKRVPMVDVFQGAATMLENALGAIERMAPSPALLGRAGGANESGRARQVLQQAGFTELSRAMARFEAWERRTYEQMWFRAVQYMTDERIVVVTDDAGARKKLALNQLVHEPQQVIRSDPATGMQFWATEHVAVGKTNDLAKMDMDITLKTVRQADTLRGEAVQAMLEWSAKTGVSVLSPDFELVIEMSDIPNKPYVLDRYRTLRAKHDAEQAQAQQAQAAQAQQAQQIAAAATQSKVERDQAQAERDHSLATKHQVEAASENLDLAVKQATIAHLSTLSGGTDLAIQAAINPPR